MKTTAEVEFHTVLESRMTDAVSPAAEEPFPEVYTAIGAVFSTNFRNCTARSTFTDP